MAGVTGFVMHVYINDNIKTCLMPRANKRAYRRINTGYYPALAVDRERIF